MSAPPARGSTARTSTRSRIPLVLGALLGVGGSLAAVVQVARTVAADRRFDTIAGGAPCYYDGRRQGDCPTPRTGPHADTAWAWAAAIDTLYIRSEGHFGPPTIVSLVGRAVPLGDPAAPYRALAGAPLDPAGAAALAARLRAAAPALPAASAAALAGGMAAAPAAGPRLPLWTLEPKQRAYDSAATARALAGRPADKKEALSTRGLLALTPPVLAPGDAANGGPAAWALVHAARAVPAVEAATAPAVERRWVLLARLPDGRWRALRVLPADPVPAAAGASATASAR